MTHKTRITCAQRSWAGIFRSGVLVALFALIGPAAAQDWIYTVRPGDNLWDLSERYTKGVGYVRALQKLNQVERPRRLQPGTRLKFPLRWLKVQPAEAEVLSVAGSARLFRAGTQSGQALAVGGRLRIGDRIVTGTEASALIRFADGSAFALRADSEVTMDSLSSYGDTGMVDTRLRLQRGRSQSDAAPARGPGSRFEIHTPAAVSAVRGTGFRVAADASAARTEVTKGRVVVSASRRARTVRENFGIVAKSGQPLAPPRPLLPAPDGRQLPRRFERLPVRVQWPELSGAARYRIQVADDARFSTLRVDLQTEQAAVSFDLGADGDYFLRLRGIDPERLEGVDLVHRFTLDARPFPPVSIEPLDGSKQRTAQPAFRWSWPVGARGVQLQIARDSGFVDRILDREYAEEHGGYTPADPLLPGTYYWRLATRDAEGDLGPFGDTLSFRYVPPPPSPVAEAPEVSEEQVTFRWRRGAPGDEYRFQLARDIDFRRMVVDEMLATSTFVLTEPRGGNYYMRIATVDADGVQGSFGETQRFEVPSKPKWWIVPLIWLGAVLAL